MCGAALKGYLHKLCLWEFPLIESVANDACAVSAQLDLPRLAHFDNLTLYVTAPIVGIGVRGYRDLIVDI